MFIGVCRMTFHLPGNNSLKGKRKVVTRLVERTRAKFNAAVSEVAQNDVHRRAVIGVAVVGNEGSHVDAMLGRIAGFMEGLGLAPLLNVETEVIPLGGDIGGYGKANGELDAYSTPGEEEW